jgi:catechol 2,3-dioxygenase-like lactoylglutathione lyase family enzyme
MNIKSLVPMAHVLDVPASIAFYRKLGFEVRNKHTLPGAKEPVWAWLQSDSADIMVSLADGPFDAGVQAVLFYLYSPDVEGLRARLIKDGVDAGPIQYPFYSPRGEFRILDPDGYVLMVSHTP